MSEELTQCALTRSCLRAVGVVWPAAAALLVLGNLVTHLLGDREAGGTQVEFDRAFDKASSIS